MPEAIHQLEDGTILGLDGETIVRGRVIQIGYDEVVYDVTEDGMVASVTGSYRGEVISQGSYTRSELTDAQWEACTHPRAEKAYREVTVREGDQTRVEREEMLLSVTVWET